MIICCEVAYSILYLLIRYHLSRENKRREEGHEESVTGEVYILVKNDEGVEVPRRVDKVCFFLQI